jgi:hypothetical protein
MIHEIKQAIWLDTPKGLALAKFLVDRGIDSDNEWICIINETGEIWSFDNSDVLVCKSYTLGRRANWDKPPNRRGSPNSLKRLLRKF